MTLQRCSLLRSINTFAETPSSAYLISLSSLSHCGSQTTEPQSPTTRALSICLLLQLLRDLHLHIEELGRAAIETDTFALVDFAFAVVFWYAFLHASLLESGISRVSFKKTMRLSGS